MSLELKDQYEKIYAFCYFKVRNRELAEDITQETFLKYFATSGYLEQGKKLAFLYTIARNLCNDHFRKVTPTVDIDSLPDLTEATADSLATYMAVRAAVAKLSCADQEIVLLRFTNELKLSEIASYLGISRFAVYRKLNAIEKQLKATLRKEDFYG